MGLRLRIAYLVLAHRNPRLLRRALRTLNCGDCGFFIHIDEKSDIGRFSGITGDNVFFTKERVPVYWGQFSQVQAVVLMLRQALEGSRKYDYFVLISGSDYPLRSAQYISRFLERSEGSEFMSCVRVPNEAAGKPLSRINTLVLPSTQPVRRFIVRAAAKFGLAKRDYREYLGHVVPYSGSTWWALTRPACRYIERFMEGNPQVTDYFRYTFASDESLFHTILGNSEFQTRIRRNFVYDDWHARGASPESIGDHHVAGFEARDEVLLDDVYGRGEALFARKFSDDRMDLVQRVDEMIARKESRAA